MKELLLEIINEAHNGSIIIDDEPWNCSFNTVLSNTELFKEDNMATLVIKDINSFLTLLEEYILLEVDMNRKFYSISKNIEKNKIKAIITCLFINATTEDFLNPTDMLRRKIAFIKDKTLDTYEQGKTIKVNNPLINGIKIKKDTHSLMMETPYKITISVTNEFGIECPLAEISYGIENNTCYIYSIMKPKDKKDISKEEQSFQKKVNRYLFKLNEGVLEQESDEFKQYKEGTLDYYPENITDVTQSFVLATTIFFSILQNENITNIKVVPYLPIRYHSRVIAAHNISDETRRQELLERNNRIQENATNKLLRTIRRVDYHFGDSSQILSYPYEQDEYMTLSLTSKEDKLNNQILNEINNSITYKKTNC